MEADQYLYNLTSCFRDEYKSFGGLNSSLTFLKESLRTYNNLISQHEENEHPYPEDESANYMYERQFIETTKINIIKAKEYIKQIEEEIANFPTYPEIPPTKPLIKITSVLEDVSFKKVIGYFDQSEYSTEKEATAKKISRDNKGAALLLLLQTFSGNIPHAPFNDGRRKQYKCIYVKGILDGKVFSGWLNKTNIKVGDKLEMAVMPEGDEYRMYAVANPQQETISTPPGCFYGSKCTSFISVVKGTAITLMIIFLCLIILSAQLPTSKEVFEGIFIYIFLTVALSFIFDRMFRSDSRVRNNLFEKVCDALLICDSKHLDLDIYTRNKIKTMKEKGERTSLGSEKSNIPQGEKRSDECAFYYYPSSINQSLER